MNEQNEQLNISEFINFPVHCLPGDSFIVDADKKMVALVGALFNEQAYTGEDGKPRLNHEAALAQQVFIGNWIADALNNAAEREAEMERLKAENKMLWEIYAANYCTTVEAAKAFFKSENEAGK